MAEKSIDTILKLSKNPSYKLTEEELEALRKHNTQFSPVRHSTDFKKEDGVIEKHDTGLVEE